MNPARSELALRPVQGRRPRHSITKDEECLLMGQPIVTAVAQFDRARLHEMRTVREWRVEDLASRAHCSAAAVRHWEAGIRVPSVPSLARIAFAFDVDVGELLR